MPFGAEGMPLELTHSAVANTGATYTIFCFPVALAFRVYYFGCYLSVGYLSWMVYFARLAFWFVKYYLLVIWN